MTRQPNPSFLNPDDFPEPHMEPVKVSEAERLAREIDGARYGDVAAELRRLAAVEQERDEDQGVIAVWRGRTQRAEAERDDWRRLTDDLKLVVESDALLLSAARQEADELRADRDRLAAEVERAHEARRQTQAQRETDYTRLMAEAKREQRERGRLAVEVEALRADAERYRVLRRGQHWSVINGIGDTLRADELDAAIDAAKASGA